MNRQELATSLRKAPAKEKSFQEKHYRVQELAKLWGLSPAAVRRLFQGVPGVIYIGQHGSSTKRSYTTMLIPASVAEKVYASLTMLAS